MTSGYGVRVEWTELILNFVGQVAWPVVALALGLFLRKPLIDLLMDGTITSLSAGPVSIGREARERVDRAERLLGPETSVEPTDTETADDSPISEDGTSKAETNEAPTVPPPQSPSPEQPTLPTPPDSRPDNSAPQLTTAEQRHKYEREKEFQEIVAKARQGPSFTREDLWFLDPTGAVMQASDDLRKTLQDLIDDDQNRPASKRRRRALTTVIKEAARYGFLSPEEVEAAFEIAGVRNRIAHSPEPTFLAPAVAEGYMDVCRRLINSAQQTAERFRSYRTS